MHVVILSLGTVSRDDLAAQQSPSMASTGDKLRPRNGQCKSLGSPDEVIRYKAEMRLIRRLAPGRDTLAERRHFA